MRRYPMSKVRETPARRWALEWGLCSARVAVRRYPCPGAKEKPQKDNRKGKFMFRNKSHSRQRHSEGSN